MQLPILAIYPLEVPARTTSCLPDKDTDVATVPTSQPDVTEASTNAEPRKSRRRKTSHLKNVPETKELRLALRDECRHIAAKLDKSRPLSKDEMETICRDVLTRLDLPEGNLGWLMVMLAS